MNSQISLLFDLDGTICDPRNGIVRCFQYALERLGCALPPEAELLKHIGPPLHASLAMLLETADRELIMRAVGYYRERFVSIGMFENSVYPGITELLAALHRQRYRLYIVTSKPTEFAREIVKNFRLEMYFNNIHGSELDGTRAEKNHLIAHVLERERIQPDQAIMIGDRAHDIQGALANGVRPIGVLWGYGSREELIRAGASLLCATPETLARELH